MDVDDSWECSRCTLRNAVGAGLCAACGCARDAAHSDSASESQSDGEGAFSDDDDAYGMAVDAPDEAAHLVDVHTRRRLWEETEAKRVAARDEAASKAGAAAAVSFDEKRAARDQIFSSQARLPLPCSSVWKPRPSRVPSLCTALTRISRLVCRHRFACCPRRQVKAGRGCALSKAERAHLPPAAVQNHERPLAAPQRRGGGQRRALLAAAFEGVAGVVCAVG